MSDADPLTPRRVYDLVMAGRAIQATNYHADQHGFKWEDDVIPALMGSTSVHRDTRPPHPDAWVAFSPHYGGRLVRVDFNRETTESGETLLVVTMMEVQK